MYKLFPANALRAEIINLLTEIFSDLTGLNLEEELSMVNWGLSVGMIHNDELVGFYLIADRNEPFGKLDGSGVQGVAMGLTEAHRGKGLRELFLNHAEGLGYDYIWGEHDKRLGNLDEWLKTRSYLGSDNDSHFTFKLLK